MTATETPSGRSSSATAAFRLDGALFDALTKELGADSDAARARLIEVDRVTLHRWREGRFSPRMDVAVRVAEKLGTTVAELFPKVAA